jgi:hypothetical protein
MRKDEIYFFQDQSQGFIRIKYVDTKPTWDNSYWVHYYSSVILDDLLELSVKDLEHGLIKESYRKLDYMMNIHDGTNCLEVKNIKVLHKVPDALIEKVKNGIFDSEVINFPFFSTSIEKKRLTSIFSKPISTKREYRDYTLKRVFSLI